MRGEVLFANIRYKTVLPLQTNERSFYNAIIIKDEITLTKDFKPIQAKKLPVSAPNQYRNGGAAVNRYFKISGTKNFAFYKVPKALFEEKYKSVSTDAKMLYGLLLDRMYLSVKNGWIDKQGRVYQYYTIKSAREKLHFGHEKICKLFSELETADLILRKRQGRGKPSIIYLKQF